VLDTSRMLRCTRRAAQGWCLCRQLQLAALAERGTTSSNEQEQGADKDNVRVEVKARQWRAPVEVEGEGANGREGGGREWEPPLHLMRQA